MSENKNNNRSLFLYTALIFFVALIMIILSFFGQSKLESNQPKIPQESATTAPISGSISEKAAALSEDNRVLLEENNKLKADIEDAYKNMKKAESEKNAALEKTNQYDLLLSAYGCFTVDNYDKAKEMLSKLNYDTLTEDMKILYDRIKNSIE